MANGLVTYSVVGRYMDGTNVIGYHFIGTDGKELPATKSRTIYMIEKGLVDNMRVQQGESGNMAEMIIRGKGINLKTLPVYDMKKQSLRGTKAETKSGKYTITHRIMRGNKCMGYQVNCIDGTTKKLAREKIIELASNGEISNAEVVRHIPSETGVEAVMLKGTNGCNILKLPVLVLIDSCKIIDPTVKSKETTYRISRMTRSGIVRNTKDNTFSRFAIGEYLIFDGSGKINVIKPEVVASEFNIDKGAGEAVCDSVISNVSKYQIEIFSAGTVTLRPEQVLSWTIIRPR